jgi:hypothetical protein
VPVVPLQPRSLDTSETFLAWEETVDHLFSAMRQQSARLGTGDATPALILEFTLLPLLRRYILGDRSSDLHRAIWGIGQ